MQKNNTTDTSAYPGSIPMARIDGAKVRQLRESRQLTQLYLSTVVGVTTDTISRWENKRYQSIKLENAEKLAKALEVPFEAILQQEEPAEPEPTPPVIEPQEIEQPLQGQSSRRNITIAVIVVMIIAGTIAYSMFSGNPQGSVAAERILPPHVSPGQTFPVLIRIYSEEEAPVSLIVKELIPQGTDAQEGLPAFTSTDRRENSLKWIRRMDKGESVYAYLCRVPDTASLDSQLVFNGTVTLKKNVNNRQVITGADSLAIAPYHWADTNRDYSIDDEEILAVYDTYSDIEELPFDRELIDNMWASSEYAWDSSKNKYIPID